MRHLTAGALCVLIASGVAAADQGRRGGQAAARPQSGTRQAVPRPQTDTRVQASTSIRFEAHHVRVIRSYYQPRMRQLPPGLQKKYARTGQLPPGWQKKMEPMPGALERDLPPLPAGYGRGVIDGHAVIYNSRTGLIVDVAVLF